MAYNNYYPMGYQNPYYQQPQQNASGLTWVQGEGAAKSYLVAPGNTVALFDNESQTIYVKSADASGMPSMKILDYTIRTEPANMPRISAEQAFATKDDVDILKSEIIALKAKFDDMEGVKKK